MLYSIYNLNPFLLFVLGAVMLYYGSEYLINNATVLAKKFNISSIIIGVTIIALGTSLPELIVSIKASIYNNTQLVIGNILGSNIANIALVLGVVMLIDVFEVKQALKITTAIKECVC